MRRRVGCVLRDVRDFLILGFSQGCSVFGVRFETGQKFSEFCSMKLKPINEKVFIFSASKSDVRKPVSESE